MITFENVSAGRKPILLSHVSLTWGPGVHAVIGSPADGVRVLMSVLAGALRPTGGAATVLKGRSWDGRIRRQIACVPMSHSLPYRLRVQEVLDTARVLRGDPPDPSPVERLANLGIQDLAGRPVHSLSVSDLRAVTVAEAVTSPGVRILAIEEPLVAMDPRAAGRIREALRAKASSGCAVVVITASLQDARDLSDDYMVMRTGTVAETVSSVAAPSTFGVNGVEMVAIMQNDGDARALAAALAVEPDVEGFDLQATCVVLRGRNPIALSRAAGRASVEAEIDIVELRPASEGSA